MRIWQDANDLPSARDARRAQENREPLDLPCGTAFMEDTVLLHIVVMTHNAESLAFRPDEHQKNERTGFARLKALAKDHDASLEGAWVNTGAHTTFALVDAPSAHVVNNLLELSGIVAWEDAMVYAVAPVEISTAV